MDTSLVKLSLEIVEANDSTIIDGIYVKGNMADRRPGLTTSESEQVTTISVSMQPKTTGWKRCTKKRVDVIGYQSSEKTETS